MTPYRQFAYVSFICLHVGSRGLFLFNLRINIIPRIRGHSVYIDRSLLLLRASWRTSQRISTKASEEGTPRALRHPSRNKARNETKHTTDQQRKWPRQDIQHHQQRARDEKHACARDVHRPMENDRGLWHFNAILTATIRPPRGIALLKQQQFRIPMNNDSRIMIAPMGNDSI